MKRCEFCGSELPANAQYCGNCGRKIDDRYTTVTDTSNPLEMGNPERQTPPLFSSPMYPNIQGSGMEWQDTDSTFRTRWSVEDREHGNPQFMHRITDENDALLPDLLLPGMLAMQSQMPSPAQAPMLQGTPQFGGVPTVQGTPATPGNLPQSIPGPAHGAASSAPSYAPQEAQFNPIHHQQVQHSGYQSSPHHYQPVHHPHPTPPPNDLEHHHRQHTGSLHEHKPQSTRLHHPAAVTSKAGMGVVSKWIMIAIASLVIIGSSIILLTHSLMPKTPPPALSITGTNVVKDGDVLHVHGQGFQPGDGVTLTIDNGLPVSFASQHGIQAISQRTGNNTQVAGFSQMNIAGALQPHSAHSSNITVSSTGTFDANVTVPSGLPAGRHTIQATDNQSSLSASLQFTIPSPQLAVNPTSLNFGSVEVGRTVKLLVTLNTQGGASLPWSAIVDGSNKNWLTLSHSSGVLAPNGSSEPIIVTANTNGLLVGSHTATLRFHSANGDAQTTVKINVISVAQSGQQAILNVSQQSLDFGQLQAGQQAQQSISIANLGNLPLQWQDSLDAGSATWLSLAATKGTVQPGAVPQTLQVKVDTTGLVAGSYSTKIHITSNGGNTQVGVTLVVTGSTVTPSPSPSPTTPTTLPPSPSPTTPTTPTTTPPTWTVSPTNLDVTNCSGSSTWTCIVTLTEEANSQVGITWTPGTDQSKVTFSPPGGTLSPGQPVKVTISSIPCSHANFTFTGSGGAQPVTALWNCSPTIVAKPQPTVTGISPASGSSTGGTPVTITGTGFIGATGVTFGQTPATNVSVTSDSQITVTSPAGSGTVDVIVTTPVGPSATSSADLFTYTAVPPTWSVNPTTLDASTCGQTAPCQVTLTEDANSTGNITWSASSNSGATFKPQNGTLSPGGQISVSIVAPCQSDTFTFSGSGGVKSLTVSWTCSSPSPTLSPSPSSTTGAGATWAGIFTYYNPNNGSQFNLNQT
jgi:IPT/TIG domain/Viral BACON domain